jgi:hypothetical protein
MRQGSTAPSGARVFAAGSLYFATGLDEWPVHGTGFENSGLQHFAVNLPTDLGGAGTNGLRLTGRLHGHMLKPGGYLLTATPQSGLGARGAGSAHFQMVR